MDDKTRLLNEAAEQAQILVFQHDAYTECATVTKINGRVRIKKMLTVADLATI
jgi:hypothetical protein